MTATLWAAADVHPPVYGTRLGRWWVWGLWLAGRLATLSLLPLHQESRLLTDVVLYHGWSLDAWQGGLLPGRDYSWEYPPGSFPLVLLPHSIVDVAAYTFAFMLQMLLFDAIVMLFVQRRAAVTGQVSGVWLWLLAVPLLGPLSLARLDMAVAAFCMVGVYVFRTRSGLAGTLLAVAAMIKLWPLVIIALLATRRDGRMRFLCSSGFTLAAAIGLASATGVVPALITSLRVQASRGLQIESLGALPMLWRKAIGGSTHLVFRHLATEVSGPGATTVATLSAVVTLVAVASLLIWAYRSRLSPRALCSATPVAVGVLLLASKVFSPQYLLWLLALTALITCERGRFSRSIVTVTCAVAALSHAVFPLLYEDMINGSVAPLILLTLRDLLLVLLILLLWLNALTAARESSELTQPGARSTLTCQSAGDPTSDSTP